MTFGKHLLQFTLLGWFLWCVGTFTSFYLISFLYYCIPYISREGWHPEWGNPFRDCLRIDGRQNSHRIESIRYFRE